MIILELPRDFSSQICYLFNIANFNLKCSKIFCKLDLNPKVPIGIFNLSIPGFSCTKRSNPNQSSSQIFAMCRCTFHIFIIRNLALVFPIKKVGTIIKLHYTYTSTNECIIAYCITRLFYVANGAHRILRLTDSLILFKY